MPLHSKRIKVRHEELEWLYSPGHEYADYGYCKRYLHLIVPHKSVWQENEKYPVILFVPGSAWYGQEMYNNIPKRLELAKRGYAIAEVQYRESDIRAFPAQVEDLRNAVKHVISIAENYHLDADTMFLAGDSSGSHTALLTGLTLDKNDFGFDEIPGVSGRIKGIIGISSPTNLSICKGDGPVEKMLGADKSGNFTALAENASCSKYITNDRYIPPVLLIHGAADAIVPPRHSRELFDALEKNGNDAELYEVEDEGHGGQSFWGKEMLDIMESFLARVSG